MADREYGAVPPPSGSNGGPSFAEALRKAREIAKTMAENAESSRKRHLDEPPGLMSQKGCKQDSPPSKYYASSSDSPPSKYYASSSASGGRIDPQRAIAEARAKAAAFVAQSRQQYGMGGVVTNDIIIPNKCVGLVIGRGGDVISRLQAESMANIQVASEGIPTPHERQITITGTPESVNKAEALIHDIVREKEGGMGMGNELRSEEILIPGPKVGMVIGKGGETIKRLQDAVGCKIIIVQDSHSVGASPKPLRIMGPPDAVGRAKKMVEDILDSVDGGHGQVTISVPVPSDMVGMIIGKQGENIRRIQMDTNTKIQFAEENNSGYRTALLSGPESGARRAESMVKDLIAQRAQDKSGRNPPGVQTVKVGVPHTRTGVVIGKGGETIRLLQQQSGAHIELDRNEEPGQVEKFFIVRGNDEQIARAKQLIKEKTDPEGGPPTATGQEGYQAANGSSTSQDPMSAYSMWYTQYAQAAAAAAAGGGSGPEQGADAAQAWAAYYQQYFSQMSGGAAQQAGQAQCGDQQSGDKQTTEGQPDYSAQWAEYYRQLGYTWPQAQAGQGQQSTAAQPNATQSTPPQPTPQQSSALQQTPQQPNPLQPTPPQQNPMQPSPMQPNPMQPNPMQQNMMQQNMMQQNMMQQNMMYQNPMQQSPMQRPHMQPNPMQPNPMQMNPMQRMPLQPTPMGQPRGLPGRPGIMPPMQPPPPGAM